MFRSMKFSLFMKQQAASLIKEANFISCPLDDPIPFMNSNAFSSEPSSYPPLAKLLRNLTKLTSLFRSLHPVHSQAAKLFSLLAN
ncbi:hypothetical protein, partial [Paenibacillus sp. NPDC058174]|uniref:hypothetical protein n=1 Tax=Paenibacillus sp. NPDC058174 TaxID=3346366 RepID=UPI0036DF9701